MLFTTWNETLPAAIKALPQLHQEIVLYFLSLPGKRRMSYAHAKQTWSLDRQQFDRELGLALVGIRQHLHRLGITRTNDLECQ